MVPATAHNVPVFGMYDGYDGAENMLQALSPFYDDLEKLQEPGFKIDGHEVKVFFNGDFKHLSACFGHQGASSSFPSLKDQVTLSHLKTHPASPHTPQHCGFLCPERKREDLVKSYVENVLDNRDPCLGLDKKNEVTW